jgi:AraC-type DNA-binding domain-containing proteins
MVAFYERRLRQFDLIQSRSLNFYPHIHNHTELIFVTHGEVEISVGDARKKLHAGECAVVFPNTAHSYLSKSENRVTVAIFHGDMVPEYAHRLTHFRPVDPFLLPDMLHADVHFAIEALKDTQLSSALRKAYLSVMVGRILQSLQTEKRPTAQAEDLLHKLLTYLDENYRQPMSLDLLATALSVSRYRISRCFSGQIGCTFNEYVNTLRTGYAAELLQNTGLTASQAGFEAGFDSLCTFYRAFKQQYGLSPKAYKTEKKDYS